MNFYATKKKVGSRGVPSDSFLTELVTFVKSAPEEIFAPNLEPDDIYASVKTQLGPWQGILHRRAVFCEVARVHGMFESSGNWKEGVDKTNKTSMKNKTGEETGLWQVSFDSEYIEHNKMRPFAETHGLGDVDSFIAKMKTDHALAIEYYARLLRINVQWAGPIKRHEIHPYLSQDAVKEFMGLLA
jgi:hypothetical protein